MECFFPGGGGVKAMWRHVWGGLTFCDDVWQGEGGGVSNRSKSRDVIYGRPLSKIASSIVALYIQSW